MGKISKALEQAEADRLKRLSADRESSSSIATAVMEAAVAAPLPPAPLEPPVPTLAEIAPETKVDERIVTLFDPRSPISEQYRILRTNLLSLRAGKAIKVILLSSSLHSEGKSVSSVNLGITLANDTNNRRVLVVDADLRAGTIHNLLGIRPKIGLSDLLAKEIPWREALVGTPLPNLSVIPRGITPPHPAELLASQKMRGLVAEMRAAYDFVIIDAPPIIPLADPGILGGLTDGAVLVIRAGKTQRKMAQQALSLLEQANVKTLGCILTHVENRAPEYIYRYYGS